MPAMDDLPGWVGLGIPHIKRFVHRHKLFTGLAVLLLITIPSSGSPLFWIYLVVIVILMVCVLKYVVRNPKARAIFAPYLVFVEPYFRVQRAQKRLNAALAHDTSLEPLC